MITACAVQVKGIPFVVCDVGGIAEMMDMSAGSANIISETSTDALYKKLDGALPIVYCPLCFRYRVLAQ